MRRILSLILFPLIFVCIILFPIITLVKTLILALRDVPMLIIVFVVLLFVLFRVGAHMYHTSKMRPTNR
ncbi:hypothetical protein [Paenibacillus wenxiniae]|uniref:Uncharacterized protein n=1 Tax=Paenibacillus wenxiniae TaxID=1636843 RepID=A0ABW4RGB9_9BACL